MSADQERLAGYVDTWQSAAEDVIALLRSLDAEDWARPTDLPGWDVRAVACHLAHLESELAGTAQTPVELPEVEHATALTSRYTEAGVACRAEMSPEDIVDELDRAVKLRLEALRADMPADPSARADITPAGIDWTWETLLRNRPLDLWMHEQDIRRAVGRPGNLDTPGAAHTVMVLAMSFPFSVGKRVAPPAGTTVVLDVTGVQPVHLAVEIADSGRAVPTTADPAEPTTRIRLDREAFVVLGGGRRPAADVDAEVTGDPDLGRRILDALTVTP